MEILFGIWFWTLITIWMGKKAVSDVAYSLKGETPPRHRERMARIERGESPQRYGVGGWFEDLQEDVLRANTTNRRAKVAKKAREKVDAIDSMVDAADVRAGAQPTGHGAAVADPTKGPGVATTPPAAPIPAWQVNPTGGAQPAADSTSKPNLRVVPDPPKPEGGQTAPVQEATAALLRADLPCPRCGTRMDPPDYFDATSVGIDTLSGPFACPACPATSRGIVDARTGAAQHALPPTASPNGSSTKGTTMNGTATQNPTVEVTGLASATAYAKAVAAAHASHSTAGGESYINSLQSFNVTGATIAAVGAAQEASSNAAAMWVAVAEKLDSQMNVKEAYNSNPDAGNQQFVQGE